MSSVAEEVNKVGVAGGETAAQKQARDAAAAIGKILAGATSYLATPEAVEAEKRRIIAMVPLEGPQDMAVPPKASQNKPKGIPESKEVPQQTDNGVKGI